MNVSVVIPTRGDVDCDEVVCSFPPEWEVILWNNGDGQVSCWRSANELEEFPVADLGVYARYAAIEYASNDLILTQDDDCIVSDPQAIVDEWITVRNLPSYDEREDPTNFVVCNMPERFREQGIYATNEHALVGFGAAFHRDAPRRAFQNYWHTGDLINGLPADAMLVDEGDFFHRTCDIVFTALTPRVLVDVPYQDLPHAHAPNRMWKQPQHTSERQRMLELVRGVK